jgi:DNA replication protein DnaC
MIKIEENLRNRSHFEQAIDFHAVERRKRAEALFSTSQIPTRHAGFKNPVDGPWHDSLMAVTTKLGSGCIYVILGTRGTGKTQLAVSLVRFNSFERLESSLYVKALDVFVALREAYRKDGDSESKIIKHFTKPSLLIIDAMEERGETPFEDRLLNHIIDKRYDNLTDTILITNQTPEAFAQSAGPSIISRIHETGDKIVCDWKSFRSQAR